jgi:HAD superfamily hydrolase (TIGR01509 family)
MDMQNRCNFVFDLDGTIIASSRYYLTIVENLCTRRELEFTPSERRHCLGMPAVAFFAEKFGAGNPEAPEVRSALDQLYFQSRIDIEHIPAFDGIVDFLITIRARGHRIALWTSREKHSTTQLLAKRGLAGHFDMVVTANCVRKHKPDPEGLHHIARHFDCCPTRLVMIGDHDVDMQAAAAAGSRAIRANWHGLTPSLPCSFGFPTAESIADLNSMTTDSDFVFG